MGKFKHFINNPLLVFNHIIQFPPICRLFDDELFLKVFYFNTFHKRLNLDNPTTFSEKLQWLKLHDRKPEYTMMVDKVLVKDYVASKIGKEYIIPTIGVWDSPDDINLDNLPNQFVLKCNHNSGGIFICKDKSKITKEKWESVKSGLRQALSEDFYLQYREWPYKNVQRKVLAEKYISPVPGEKDLPDYKFFCFDGEVKALFVATERQIVGEEVKFDFFDADFNHLSFRQGHEQAADIPPKPQNFEMMKQAASKLSKGIPQARIDLYEVGEKMFFGEVTFFHFSGFMPFRPNKWDKVFGSWITLPQNK